MRSRPFFGRIRIGAAAAAFAVVLFWVAGSGRSIALMIGVVVGAMGTALLVVRASCRRGVWYLDPGDDDGGDDDPPPEPEPGPSGVSLTPGVPVYGDADTSTLYLHDVLAGWSAYPAPSAPAACTTGEPGQGIDDLADDEDDVAPAPSQVRTGVRFDERVTRRGHWWVPLLLVIAWGLRPVARAISGALVLLTWATLAVLGALVVTGRLYRVLPVQPETAMRWLAPTCCVGLLAGAWIAASVWTRRAKRRDALRAAQAAALRATTAEQVSGTTGPSRAQATRRSLPTDNAGQTSATQRPAAATNPRSLP